MPQKRKPKSKILLNFLLITFSAHLFVRTISATVTEDKDNPTLSTQKLSNFSLLSSSGHSPKSRNSIFRNKFPPKNHDTAKFINLLLILSGNIELNPGPAKNIRFPCGICHKSCTWRQASVACDNCNTWYHKNCMNMNSQNFNNLRNISWYCDPCGLPNFSSGLFNSSNSINCSNSFGSLSDLPRQPEPCLSSTPKSFLKSPKTKNQVYGLNSLLINFQSYFNKRAELANLVEETKCDVIIGTETWLTDQIQNSELLLDDFDIFRKDRKTRGGGVLIAIKKTYVQKKFPHLVIPNPSFVKLTSKAENPHYRIRLQAS